MSIYIIMIWLMYIFNVIICIYKLLSRIMIILIIKTIIIYMYQEEYNIKYKSRVYICWLCH